MVKRWSFLLAALIIGLFATAPAKADAYAPFGVSAGFEWQANDYIPPISWSCNRNAADLWMRIQLIDGQSAEPFIVYSPCKYWSILSRSRAETRRWSARIYRDGSIDITLKENRAPFKLRVRITQGGTLIFSSISKVRWIKVPSRRIWDETDAFWNYCLNGGRTIRLENGRFYCSTPDRSYHRVISRRLPNW